jgi:acetylornithine deacetylase/succinyl-diaminopimelate desuccinylase-like protein
MLTAAKLILHSHNKATELGCLASTGILTLKPGSTNTVPGYVQFSLDIRSKEDKKLDRLQKALKEEFAKIASGEDVGGINTLGTKGRSCSVEWQEDSNSPATKFHEDCIKCVEESAHAMLGTNAGGQVQRMTSGAGHDREVLRPVSRMIFSDSISVFMPPDGHRHRCEFQLTLIELLLTINAGSSCRVEME